MFAVCANGSPVNL